MADRTVSVSLVLQAQGYMAGVDKASQKTREMGSEAEKLAQKRDGFDRLGKAALGVGAAMVAATGLAVKSAIDWESAWAGVTKTVDGTAEELAMVEGGLRGLTGVLPATHEEIAGVAEAAGQLGVQTGNVVSFTRTMIDLGETTNLSANDAATALARFINIMGTSQDDVDRLGSAVVGLGNNYATTEAEIVEMSMRLAGAGRQIGMSEGDVLGLATALSSVGIEAEAGGSAMSKVMIDIAASVEEGGDRLTKFAQVSGMSADAFSAQWRKNPGEALAAFVRGLSNAEEQGKSALGILADFEITEVRMRDALLRSSAAADVFSTAMAQGNDEFEANNALTEEAAKRYETAESKIRIAGNAIKDASIDIGGVFLPVLADASEGVADLASWFAGLPESVQATIGILGGAAGSVALVGGAALIAVPKVADFMVSMKEMGVTWKAIGRGGALAAGAAAGIGLVVGAMAELHRSAQAARSAVSAAIEAGNGAEVAAGQFKNDPFAWLTGGNSKTQDAIAALEQANGEIAEWNAALGKSRDATEGMGAAGSRVALMLVSVGKDLGMTTDEAEALHDTFRFVGSSLDDLNPKNAADAFASVRDEMGATNAEALAWAEEYAPGMVGGLRDLADEAGVASEGTEFLNWVFGETESATTAAADGADGMADSLVEVGSSAEEVQTKVDELADAVRGFGSAELSVRDAHRGFEAAFDDLTASIEENGSTLDRSTEAGRSNEEAIDSLVGSTLELAAATFEQTRNEEDAARIIGDGRQALLDKLEAFGITGEAAEDYADKLGLIPDAAITSIKLSGVDEAEQALNALARHREAKVTVRWSEDGESGSMMGGRTITPNAIGNLYELGKPKEFAAGGWASGVGMARATPGGLLKVAEAGFDEAIISTDPQYRARSLDIWAEMGGRLGAFKPSPDYVLAQQAGNSGAPRTEVRAPITIQQRPGVSDRRIAQVAQEELAFGL